MRNLTIKRQKSFVGSMVSMKVYIEDAMSTDLTINGIACRRLGTLKNGEEKTFTIEDHSMKLFVIADVLSKDAYNEVYTIPAGTEPISLSGKNHYNPMYGNPFRFDGVTAEDTLQNRKKTSKKTLGIMICAVVIGLVVGVAAGLVDNIAPKPETFTADGFQITLLDDFIAYEEEGIVAGYYNADVTLEVSKVTYVEVPVLADCSLEDYCLTLIESLDVESEPSFRGEMAYFEFEVESLDGESTYNCFVTIYKRADAFWFVEYLTDVDQAMTHRSDILTWADSVVITD